MKKNIFRLLIFLASFLPPQLAYAHCPLCTLGAGAAALAATWFGIQTMAVAVFLGAFGLALGLWLGRIIKIKLIPHQTGIIGILSFLLTILPLQPLFQDYTSFYVNLGGVYGSPLNRTYAFDRFLLGAVLGAGLLFLSPLLSRALARKINIKIPFQGMIFTLLLLFMVALFIQFTV